MTNAFTRSDKSQQITSSSKTRTRQGTQRSLGSVRPQARPAVASGAVTTSLRPVARPDLETITAVPREMPAEVREARAAAAAEATQAVEANAILENMQTTGASARTARQDRIRSGGVAASRTMAETDRNRVMRHRQEFEELGAKYDLPPAVLAAVASRETRGGNILDRNGYGDHGNGFGLMQVDKRYHTIQGSDNPRSRAHLEQATSILADFHQQIQNDHPNWSPEQHLQGAVAAYNAGPGRMTNPETFDRVTTGRDYSNDVIARAQYYAENWN